jgi:hypothetical protein
MGYNQAMPAIDRRHQLDIENQRADLKQEMWLKQQQRMQDQYDTQKQRQAAGLYAVTHQDALKGLLSGETLPPELQGADPALLDTLMNRVSPEAQRAADLQKLLLTEEIKSRFKTPAKPGTDVLSQFIRMYGRKPTSNAELFQFSQGLKGKSGMSISFDENGNPVITTGGASPTNLTTGAKTKAQKDLMASVSALDNAKNVIGNFNLDWLGGWNKLGADVGASVDKWLPILPDSAKDYLSERSAGIAGFAQQANEEIHRLTGARMSEFEGERLLKGIPNEDDKPVEARGKLLNFYNTLAMAEARHKFFVAQGIPATDENFDKWKDADKDRTKAAILSKYGYTPITFNDLDKMIGANLGGEQKVGAPDAGPVAPPAAGPIDPSSSNQSKEQRMEALAKKYNL